jgi:hypothetical protein
MKPWFRNYFPVHPWGWLVYVASLALLVWDFRAIDRTSQSVGDTFFTFFPHVAGVFLLVAIILRAKSHK